MLDVFLCASPPSPPPSYTACTAVISPIAFVPNDELFPLTPRPTLLLPFDAESPVVRASSFWPTSPLTPLADTPPPRSRRGVAKQRTLRSSRLILPASSPSPSPARSPSPDVDIAPIFTTRTFPGHTVPQSPLFPLLYRRFPVSSFYAPSPSSSPLTLFNPSHPGGTYNPPRSPLDLYTPRFVRGKGATKHGLCPICIEPRARGGSSRRLWLAMKFSAFKCYHMQYYHGISAATQRPFSPPLAFRITPRPNPAKHERTSIREAKCHKCARWVPVEGIKDVEPKVRCLLPPSSSSRVTPPQVKELFWWKHAAACHGHSSIDAPHDVYEHDSVYAVVSQL
ncbi:hypothetical protein C0995_005219 [Termitomyces sp. Mi166|nr:hypothetical protein C0995_005219 [Termitomyces sp. Mi166\